MSPKELEKLILSLTQDITFVYDGIYACINPWNPQKIEVGYGDIVKTYDNIQDVMQDDIYHGKSLAEICGQLDID